MILYMNTIIPFLYNKSRIMINPQEILASYSILISGQSTQIIKNAEQRLRELYDLPSFLEINKMILLEDQLSVSVKKMSAVHLAHFAKKNKRSCVLPIETIVKEFLEILCSEKLDYTLKPLLIHPLEDVLADQSNQNFRSVLANNLIQSLSGNSVNYKEVVYLGQALLGKKANSKDIKSLVNSTFAQYNAIAAQLHGEVAKVTQKETLINLLRLIGDYSKLIRAFIARIGLLDIQTSNLLFSQQLEESVRTAFELTVPGNAFGSHLFFLVAEEETVTYLLNFIKRNYVSILAAFLRILLGFVKNPAKLATNPLYMKSSFILDYCLQATSDLLQNQAYYQLPTKTLLVACLFETLGLIITALRNNDFYEVIRKNRTQLIEKILLPCLSFSPQDLDEFYENQTEFVDKILQIVEKESNPKKRRQDSSEGIEMFDTLKTYSGECIRVLCKYQDEVLAEVFEFTMNVLEGKVGCPLPKSVFLLLITLLKPRINNRADFQTRLGLFLTSVLKETDPPHIKSQDRKEEDIQYALLLLSVSKYAPDLSEINSQLLPVAFQRGVSILQQSNEENQVFKILVFQMFDEVNRLQNGQEYALDLLNLYNSLLVKEPSLRLLDSYSQLLQYNLEYFFAHLQPLLSGIFIICKLVEKELQKPMPVSLFLNKSLNVVREVGESSIYLPKVIPELEQALLPLLPFIDDREGIDLEQDVLLMLAAFLEHGKSVTLAQQQMFQIIPKIFYHQYHCTFGQAFTTVHSFIYYGAGILANAPQAIQAIIEMSIASMTLKQSSGRVLTEIDNCEGVLILQSLALACGSFLPKETWIVVLTQVVNKLSTQIASNKLTANLLGLISLCLVHTQHLFSNDENLGLLGHILTGASKCVKVAWSQKVLIAGLSELMTNLQKDFIKSSFGVILQLILILLQASTIKTSIKQAIIGSLDNDDDDEQDYDNLIELVKNNLKALDEFTFFRTQFNKLHSNSKEFVVEVVEKLPMMHKDFLNRILMTEKIENEARAIFKVKKS